MNKTVELVRKEAQLLDSTTLTPHYQRLESVLGRKVATRTIADIDRQLIRSLQDLGFYWFVRPNFALKFHYHAAIFCPCVGYFDFDKANVRTFWYCGDLPDSVLAKLEVIKDVKHFDYRRPNVTVHSLLPLPIEIERRPPLLEPVAIAWNVNPMFDKTWWGWRSWNPNAIGVVIAVWDADKELPVYEGG